MNEAMEKLIEAVQKASPVVWQAAYRQVWIEAFEYFCGSAFFLVLLILYVRRWREALLRFADPTDEEDRIFVSALSNGIILILAGAAFGIGLEVLGRLINPTFAAIKNLKGLL